MKLAPLRARPRARPKPAGRRRRPHAGVGLQPAPLRDPNTGTELRARPWSTAGILPKLEVGPVNDPLEHQADAIADRVMRMPAPTPAAPKPAETQEPALDEAAERDEEHTEAPAVAALAGAADPPGARGPAVHRECSTCTAEDDDLHRSVDTLVQRACSSCDAEDELQRSAEPQLRRACTTCEAEDDELHRMEDEDELQRACTSCDEGDTLHREAAASVRGGRTSQQFTTQVRNLQRGGGRQLPGSARAFLEPRLGVDLGSVRVHADAQAGALAKRVGAKAFTLGQHVFFAAGQLRPQSQGGMRLLAHEVAHTLQSSGGVDGDSLLSRGVFAPERDAVRRNAADDLVSSRENTADEVLDDVLQGVILSSAEQEDRIQKLTPTERRRLRALLESQSFESEQQDEIEELRKVLRRVESGHRGETVGHIESRPCRPDDVTPVTMSEWTGDLVITDLELMGGTNHASGKLGRHTPEPTLRLVQRALVEWGCRSASPARNPLPVFGVDGKFGKEFRQAVRQFQRSEGLPVNGKAGPATIRKLGVELHGVKQRQNIERASELAELREELQVQQAESDERERYEARIDEFLRVLWKHGERYRRTGSEHKDANSSFLVSKQLQDFDPEIISEGLERVRLGYPEFYQHVMFGGRLISELQERGVYGVRFVPPSDVDFLDGFVIETNELEHASPYQRPNFPPRKIPRIFAGFVIGVHQGIFRAEKELVEGLNEMRKPEFWKAMRETLGKIIEEPRFRFDIGRVAAEAAFKQIQALNASKPKEYGRKLGVVAGMLVFEIAAAMMTAGGALAIEGVRGAEILSKLPRLERLVKRLASTSLIRAGARSLSKVRTTIAPTLERAADIGERLRRLLPNLTNNARLSAKLRQFASTDAAEASALALDLQLSRKLDDLDIEKEKLELLLQQSDPDLAEVDRLADSIRRKSENLDNHLEELTDHAPPSLRSRAPDSLDLGNDQVTIGQMQRELDFIDAEFGVVDGHSQAHFDFGDGQAKWEIDGRRVCRFNSPGRCDDVDDAGKIDAGARQTADAMNEATSGASTQPVQAARFDVRTDPIPSEGYQRPRVATASKYRWRNYNLRRTNFIDADLDTNGVLEVTVRAEGGKGKVDRRRGTTMLDDVFSHFGAGRIRAFNAVWAHKSGFETNLREFLQNLKTMTPENAAWNTWTGRYLKARGWRGTPRVEKRDWGRNSGYEVMFVP